MNTNKKHFEYWYDFSAPITSPVIPFKYMVEMVCDRIAASKIYNSKSYNDSFSYYYFIERKDSYNINPNMNSFLEEVFFKLMKNGETILNKKELYKIYTKYAKDDMSNKKVE